MESRAVFFAFLKNIPEITPQFSQNTPDSGVSEGCISVLIYGRTQEKTKKGGCVILPSVTKRYTDHSIEDEFCFVFFVIAVTADGQASGIPFQCLTPRRGVRDSNRPG